MTKLYFCIFTVLFTSGCGDNFESINAGGVSLGGTGLPTAGGGNVPPLTTEQNNNEYIIWTKGLYINKCSELNIAAFFLNSETHEPIYEIGNGTFVRKSIEANSTNLTIVVSVTNESLYPIYEYRNKCEVPVVLKDQNLNTYEPVLDQTCINNFDDYQILMPSQTWSYNLKYNIPQEVQNWNLAYEKAHTLNQYFQVGQREDCPAFSLNFTVEKM